MFSIIILYKLNIVIIIQILRKIGIDLNFEIGGLVKNNLVVILKKFVKISVTIYKIFHVMLVKRF